MPSYTTLTFITGLIFTGVTVASSYLMNDKQFVGNWWIMPLIMLILTLLGTIVVGRVNNRNENNRY